MNPQGFRDRFRAHKTMLLVERQIIKVVFSVAVGLSGYPALRRASVDLGEQAHYRPKSAPAFPKKHARTKR
jgi:hypothetical protein